MKQRKAKVEKESAGTVVGAKYRARCNDLSDNEREKLNEEFLKLHSSDPEIEAAWQTEIARRVEEIQSGKVQGLPGEEVSARVRKIVGR